MTYFMNKELLNKNVIQLEIIHLAANKCCRYVYPLLFDCFEWDAMVLVTKSNLHC